MNLFLVPQGYILRNTICGLGADVGLRKASTNAQMIRQAVAIDLINEAVNATIQSIKFFNRLPARYM